MSSAQFLLDGWRICLDFAMNYADDFVVYNPLTIFIFMKGNSLRISSGFEVITVLWFHQVWSD